MWEMSISKATTALMLGALHQGHRRLLEHSHAHSVKTGVKPKAWFDPDQKSTGSGASNASTTVGGGESYSSAPSTRPQAVVMPDLKLVSCLKIGDVELQVRSLLHIFCSLPAAPLDICCCHGLLMCTTYLALALSANSTPFAGRVAHGVDKVCHPGEGDHSDGQGAAGVRQVQPRPALGPQVRHCWITSILLTPIELTDAYQIHRHSREGGSESAMVAGCPQLSIRWWCWLTEGTR